MLIINWKLALDNIYNVSFKKIDSSEKLRLKKIFFYKIPLGLALSLFFSSFENIYLDDFESLKYTKQVLSQVIFLSFFLNQAWVNSTKKKSNNGPHPFFSIFQTLTMQSETFTMAKQESFWRAGFEKNLPKIGKCNDSLVSEKSKMLLTCLYNSIPVL